MQWTDERIETLKRRWAEGWSATEIASRLPGISRSAVLGKVHRLGLEKRRTATGGRHRNQGHAFSRRIPLSAKEKATIKKMWNEDGATMKEIAEALGRHIGTIDNAIYQGRELLGLERRQKVSASHNTETDAPAGPSPMPVVARPNGERHTIITLKANMCRWPIGDPGDKDFHFCGCYAPVGQPYCAEHMKVAYQPAPPRRRVTPSRASRVA